MITIKETSNNGAEIHIYEGTSGTTIILGIDMLVEAIVKDIGMSIDEVLKEVKRIYERDLEEKEKDIRGE